MSGIGYEIRARLDLAVLVPPEEREISSTVVELSATLAGVSESLRGIGSFMGGQITLEDLPDPSIELEEAKGEVANVVGLEVVELNLTRNAVGTADVLNVTVEWNALPVDPRVYEGAQWSLWIFTHGDPAACKPGDAGHFAGIVDKVRRRRREGLIDLQCRDWTALPLATQLEPAHLAALDLDQPLWRVVEQLIAYMPGGDAWKIVPRGRALEGVAARSVAYTLGEERTFRQRAVVEDREGLGPEVEAAAKLIAAGFTDERLPVQTPLGSIDPDAPGAVYTALEQRQALEATDLRNPTSVAALEAHGLDAALTADVVRAMRKGRLLPAGAWRKYSVTTRPARVVKQHVPATFRSIFGTDRLNVWQAVQRVCGLMGFVAEVCNLASGDVGVAILAIEDLVRGDVFRRFERRGADGETRYHRTLTEGASIDDFDEERDLFAGRRVDYVSVLSPNPDTGKVLGPMRFGKPNAEGKPEGHGLTLTVPGITTPDHLATIARALWLSANAGTLRLRVSTVNPWSDGGGPDSPDLLWAGAGSLLEIRFAGFDEALGGATGRRHSIVDVLRLQGLSPAAADILGRASERADTSLVFQIAKTTIRYSGQGEGAFSCALDLQTFLSTGEPPVGTLDAASEDDAGEVEAFDGGS